MNGDEHAFDFKFNNKTNITFLLTEGYTRLRVYLFCLKKSLSHFKKGILARMLDRKGF